MYVASRILTSEQQPVQSHNECQIRFYNLFYSPKSFLLKNITTHSNLRSKFNTEKANQVKIPNHELR